MTLPPERKRAVENTREFLWTLLNPAHTPRVPKLVRIQARYLLKHYPHNHEMDEAAKLAPKIFGRWRSK